MHKYFTVLSAALVFVATSATAIEYREQVFETGDNAWRLKLPAGYALEHLAAMNGPRLMVFDDDGRLLVGSGAGRVYRLDPPYVRATVYAALSGYPHDVALRDGMLFVAKSGGIYRAPYRAGRPAPLGDDDFTLVAALPPGGGHSSRSIGVGPDGRIYASLGISGNCNDQYLDDSYRFEDRRGGVFVLVEAGAGKQARWQPHATGLRNPIGFDWHPGTGVLYASNHGPDHHGYEQPPEYFSRLAPGSFHGMPWFQFDGDTIKRDSCIRGKPPRTDAIAPVAVFPARNGPMGVAFSSRGQPGTIEAGDAVVALHGSWATRPHGRHLGKKSTRRPPWVAVVRFDEGRATGEVEALIEGFQDAGGTRLARPVGVAFGPDGALYFTSDGGALKGLFRLKRM